MSEEDKYWLFKSDAFRQGLLKHHVFANPDKNPDEWLKIINKDIEVIMNFLISAGKKEQDEIKRMFWSRCIECFGVCEYSFHNKKYTSPPKNAKEIADLVEKILLNVGYLKRTTEQQKYNHYYSIIEQLCKALQEQLH